MSGKRPKSDVRLFCLRLGEKFMKKFRPLVLLSVGLLSATGLTPVARAKTPVVVTPVASDRPVDLDVGDLQMVAEFEQQVVGVAVSASGRVFVSGSVSACASWRYQS